MTTRLHHRVWTALRSFLARRAAERELDDELRFHFEQMQAYEAARAMQSGRSHERRPSADAAAIWRIRSGERGLPRHAHTTTARRLPQGPALRRAPARARPGLLDRRDPLARARHRRDQRDLLADQRDRAARAAGRERPRAVSRADRAARSGQPAILVAGVRSGAQDGLRPRRDGRGQQHPLDAARAHHRRQRDAAAGIRPRAAGLG